MKKLLASLIFVMVSQICANDDVSIMDLKELTYYLMEDNEKLSASLKKNISKMKKDIKDLELKNIKESKKLQSTLNNNMQTVKKSIKDLELEDVKINKRLKKLEFLDNYVISKKLLDYYGKKIENQ